MYSRTEDDAGDDGGVSGLFPAVELDRGFLDELTSDTEVRPVVPVVPVPTPIGILDDA